MIQRFAALMVVAGLGTGVVLRILAGRQRFGTFLALAHLPLLYHVTVTTVSAFGSGITALHIGLFALGGVVIGALGSVIGRRLIALRPWWAAVTPGLSLVAYLVAAVLPFSRALRAAGVTLDTVPLFGTILGVVFTVAALVPFAPPPVTGPRLPRFPWQR